MTTKKYNKAKSEAEKLVSKIDKFIDSIAEENEYTYKAARLSLPKYVVNNIDFHFVDCIVLADEKPK